MTNLDSILESRDITLPTNVRRVKATVFPVVMYGCVNWTIKKAELMLLNCGVGEDSCESLGLQGDDFPGSSTGVDCHFLLQGIFPTQGLNPGLAHCTQTLYRLSHQGSLEIQPVHYKGDQTSVFIGRTDAEAETPILWPPDAKS